MNTKLFVVVPCFVTTHPYRFDFFFEKSALLPCVLFLFNKNASIFVDKINFDNEV